MGETVVHPLPPMGAQKSWGEECEPKEKMQAGHLLQNPLLWGWVGEIGHGSITLEFGTSEYPVHERL